MAGTAATSSATPKMAQAAVPIARNRLIGREGGANSHRWICSAFNYVAGAGLSVVRLSNVYGPGGLVVTRRTTRTIIDRLSPCRS